MAKRRRLGPATLIGAEAPAPETKSMPPIAQVAGAEAAQAAIQELSDEISTARAEGRLVQEIPLENILVDHLSRDRIVVVSEDMAALKASIAERGQQMPIDVVETEAGFGLISGWRRLQALKELHAETGDVKFAHVRAVLRRPEGAAEAYLAMVEENELRVGLSYYERAQVAARAAESDVFESSAEAIAALFPTASKAKKSKIASFVKVHHVLGDVLRFPWEIPERLGLRLAKAIADGQGGDLRAALMAREMPSGAAEMAALIQVLDRKTVSKPPHSVDHAGYGEEIEVSFSRGTLRLKGAGVTDGLVREIELWLSERHKRLNG